jgi:septum formation protein
VGERATLVLASASPARLRTLRAGGIEPRVVVSGVDESLVEASDPRALCAALARMKAEAVAGPMATDDPAAPRVVVLGCDSVLEFDGQALGKPADAAEATQRWQRMRGRRGILHTGHCLIDVSKGARVDAVAGTTVHFADVTDEEIAAYIGTGEPLHVAGAFTIDGLGGWFIERVEGDPGTVIGVSLPLLRRLLSELGVGVHDLWAGRPVPATSPP